MAEFFTPEEARDLAEKQSKLRLENEFFLREHPELQRMLSAFMVEVLDKKPSHVVRFAAKFFTRPDLLNLCSPPVVSTPVKADVAPDSSPYRAYLDLLNLSGKSEEQKPE
mmetsp:Transcript_141/g.264  ORF Transcript_141/g.264 Transcript_141/m.264 type:complete len:110 (+) Transcript_141:150-479(+)|eukprot:CAMPEP_0184661622 /NCGR_PEP_ID=MMETSP0308-20130426/39309_1 /TAXON_ID=38269 /ORGANISM="Gloeochaete witrockiana, Strain SAG 46.84" /LENGTH=109 /DNA_ID=CAMNT_0027103051 /DNA_START=71 /DNA_END=400 /DNA_ORIENTATION=+